jgi:hypothetical protein
MSRKYALFCDIFFVLSHNMVFLCDKGGNMTDSKIVQERLFSIEAGGPFTMGKFQGLARPDNIRQILNRLCRKGSVKRLAAGVYCKPIKSEILEGEIDPPILEILKAFLGKKNEKIVPHGANALKQLSLST